MTPSEQDKWPWHTPCALFLQVSYSSQQMHIKQTSSITIFVRMYFLIVFVLTVITFTQMKRRFPSKDGVSDQLHDHHLLKTFVNDKFWKTGSTCDVKAWISSKYNPSIYGATAPSLPWPPSEDASILLRLLLVSSILLFLGSLMCPSGRRPSILFLVFPLVFFYEISHQELFWGDNSVFHS